jgi:hypothetical protein
MSRALRLEFMAKAVKVTNRLTLMRRKECNSRDLESKRIEAWLNVTVPTD